MKHKNERLNTYNSIPVCATAELGVHTMTVMALPVELTCLFLPYNKRVLAPVIQR